MAFLYRIRIPRGHPVTTRTRTGLDWEATVASLAVENEQLRADLDRAQRSLARLAETVLAAATPGTDLHSQALTAKYLGSQS